MAQPALPHQDPSASPQSVLPDPNSAAPVSTSNHPIPPAPAAADPTPAPPTPPAPTTDTSVPQSGRRKEILQTPVPGESAVIEASADVAPLVEAVSEQPLEQAAAQPQEYESAQVELESTIEKLQDNIEKNKIKGPEKVAIRQDTSNMPLPKTVAQPVVILPLTEEKMQQGKKKDLTHSIRWLVAWASRQIKKFQHILVVYRDKPLDPK